MRNNLKALAAQKGFTLQELAKQLALNPHTLYAWSSGRTSPTPHNLERLQAVLGEEIQALYRAVATPNGKGRRCPGCHQTRMSKHRPPNTLCRRCQQLRAKGIQSELTKGPLCSARILHCQGCGNKFVENEKSAELCKDCLYPNRRYVAPSTNSSWY